MSGHREVVEGQWEAIAIKCTSPRAMSMSRSEILRKQEHKVSYRCSLPSPLQKGSKDYKILHRSSARFFDFGKKFLRNLRNFLPSVQENSEAQNFQNLPILGSLLQW